jgi:hypothetical protein
MGIPGDTGPAQAIPFATLSAQLFGGPQTANTVYAGPTSGGVASLAFRALVAADIPSTLYGGSAAGSTLTLQSTSNGSPSGDVANLYGSTVTLGNSRNAASVINLSGASGGGVTVNIAAAGNGLNALNVYNGLGSKQQWVRAGGVRRLLFRRQPINWLRAPLPIR